MAKKRVDSGFLPYPFKEPKTRDYVVAELRHDSKIAFSARGFGAPAERENQARSLNNILEGFKIKSLSSLFEMPASKVRRRSIAAPPSLRVSVSADFAHSGFVQIVPTKAKDCYTLASR